MKTQLTILFFVLLCQFTIFGQDKKYIEVDGSAEMLVTADSYDFAINIDEYWIKEHNKRKVKYVKKIKIEEIENQLLKHLKEIGVKKNQIKVADVGQYWIYINDEILIRKKYILSLKDFNLINKLTYRLSFKGVSSMEIVKLKNKKITAYRKEVKKTALLAAKQKATYLLEVLDKQLGAVISIVEINNDSDFVNKRYNTYERSNTWSNSPMLNELPHEGTFRNQIKLRYEIKARFGIK